MLANFLACGTVCRPTSKASVGIPDIIFQKKKHPHGQRDKTAAKLRRQLLYVGLPLAFGRCSPRCWLTSANVPSLPWHAQTLEQKAQMHHGNCCESLVVARTALTVLSSPRFCAVQLVDQCVITHGAEGDWRLCQAKVHRQAHTAQGRAQVTEGTEAVCVAVAASCDTGQPG